MASGNNARIVAPTVIITGRSRTIPADYKGTVDGDTLKGTMTGKGKTGDWTATRAK